jgi:AraC-like DNA-binding protein
MLIGGRSRQAPRGAWTWPAGLIVWGPGHHASLHAHHSLQVVMTLEGHLAARDSNTARWRSAGAVIVRPDAMHEIDARDRSSLIAFIEPESALGRDMMSGARAAITVVAEPHVRRWRRRLGAPSSIREGQLRAWLERELATGGGGLAMDPRVARVIRTLRSRPGDLGDTSLASLAGLARLSPSRFAHLFAASVGIPVRRYVLWLRVQRAGAALNRAASLTEAAYVAGFSDAAHLTRTFRRMLGLVPSEVARRRAGAREVRLDDHRR